jgi:hypothetical protein
MGSHRWILNEWHPAAKKKSPVTFVHRVRESGLPCEGTLRMPVLILQLHIYHRNNSKCIIQPVRLILSASHLAVFFSHNKSASAKIS